MMRIAFSAWIAGLISLSLILLPTTGCSDDDGGGSLCGNGVIEGAEQCDGENLGSNDCTTVGDFSGGTLRCTSGCVFDTADCVPSTECGNGQIQNAEVCDGENLAGEPARGNSKARSAAARTAFRLTHPFATPAATG